MNELKKEVMEMEHRIEEIKQEEKSLAYLLLEDLKKTNKRIFVICIIEAIIIISMFVGFLIYQSQFETIVEGETTTIESGNGIATYLENSESGEIIYGEDYEN